MDNWTDEELIGYCEIHCETDVALFSGRHVNRMLALAGHPDCYVRSVPAGEFISLHDNMAHLCKLARERLVSTQSTSAANSKEGGEHA